MKELEKLKADSHVKDDACRAYRDAFHSIRAAVRDARNDFYDFEQTGNSKNKLEELELAYNAAWIAYCNAGDARKYARAAVRAAVAVEEQQK